MPLLDLPPPPEPLALTAPLPPENVSEMSSLNPAHFMPGNVDMSVRLAFDGFDWTPLSLVTSLVGWLEFQAAADVGVLPIRDTTLGFGVELFYARPWMIQALSTPLLQAATDEQIRWAAADRGVAARATLHYHADSNIDPYGLVLAGPTVFDLSFQRKDLDGLPEGSLRTAVLRMGVGIGTSLVWDNGVFVGAELRYLVSYRFQRQSTVDVRDEDGETVDTVAIRNYQKPPHGFSWVAQLGRRF